MDLNKKLRALQPKVKKEINSFIQEIAKHIDYLYELATIDEKTGVYNHKFFKTIADMEFEKARRKIQPLALMIVDLDHFKKINDTYGHLVGDTVLKQLGHVLKENVRKYDIVARFGGEEFLVLFPNTNLMRARKVSDRLRRKVAEDKFMKRYAITFSGGISQYHDNDTLARMKVRADKALYRAKQAGRNRIELE
jgi:diguanylate cyclase